MGYEILSEPRDKDLTKQEVHDFYEAGCEAVQAVDPVTPCIVGSASYYKMYTFTSDVIISSNKNVIYTFDYFDPDYYVFGEDQVPLYPGVYPCNYLYSGWSSECCPLGAKANTTFDYDWNRGNFDTWALPVRDGFDVPVFVNQWSTVHGLSAEAGRFQFMSDVASVMQDLNIGWTWWMFRGGGGDGWAHGSSELVYMYENGTLEVDQQAL